MNILFDSVEMKDVPMMATPFNDVDSLIFSTLAYCDFSQILANGSAKFCNVDPQIIQAPSGSNERYQNHYQLLKNVVSSCRYQDFEISDFVNIFCNQTYKQFAGVTFACKKFVYVAFRGTDATITGWKEDANLSFMESIPAQEEALLYLKKIVNYYTV